MGNKAFALLKHTIKPWLNFTLFSFSRRFSQIFAELSAEFRRVDFKLRGTLRYICATPRGSLDIEGQEIDYIEEKDSSLKAWEFK